MKCPRIAALVFAVSSLSCLAATGVPDVVLPALNANPGPEYADSARKFQGIPTIERAPNGRLWAAWYGGGVTEDAHNYIVLDTSGDDGVTWQRAMILDPDRDGPVRAFDPCLWHDPSGRLWLFWAQRPDERPADLLAITTTDSGSAGAKWTAPRRVMEGIMMNKPLVTADGRWLMPTAVWKSNDSARVFVSTDQGSNFARLGAAGIPFPKDRNCDEEMLVERADQSLWMLVRTGYGIGGSTSRDGGRTWSDVARTGIPHPASRFFIRRLNDDKLLLVRHNPPGGASVRSHLTAYLSDDDGATWKGGLVLDERSGVSYPDGVQAAGGRIFVIYDFDRYRQKEILMAVFREADVLAGKCVSDDARLRVLVNKAGGTNASIPAAVPAKREANADGRLLRKGRAPELEYSEGELDTFAPGASLFLDRKYVAQEVPPTLNGLKFIRSNITGGRFTCRQPGTVFLLTPSAGRQKDSLADDLTARDFEKVALPEFMLFDGEQNVCTVFQKDLARGETLDVGKWAVLVLPDVAAKPGRVSSVELAASTNLLTLWDPRVPFPEWDAMRDLPVVTHVQVERAQKDGFHYLHEPAIAWHNDVLFAGWANHPKLEVNVRDEVLRGRTSRDGGFTWSDVSTWIAAPALGGESFNHPVLFRHQDRLWGFFTRWEKERPRTEIFTLDDATGAWKSLGCHIPGFLPFTPPRKMSDGNWILAGELHWYEAAVAISHGDDFTQWEVVQIPRPAGVTLQFPETTLFERGDELFAICRPKDMKTAPAAMSRDHGRTWSPLQPSNFPLAASKPLCGRLSNGRQYLITCNLEQGRALLSIAVTDPGGSLFNRIWKIRHQQTPKRRLLGSLTGTPSVGNYTEWSYPSAVEHDGKLYVLYTQGKEDCALSICPIDRLGDAP